ncbi:MAG TPA: hypothetical protein PK691_02320, partial [Thermomicrobiales bacterium]|nr:hypothetical protein [Thermomicrobiales bacterium]
DSSAAQLVRSLRDGSEFKLDDYPEYPTSLSIEDDTASFAVAYGNVVVVGVTSEEQLTWFGFAITDGTLEQRSGILAEYGVRRIERLAGAPRLGPSAGGTW